MSEQTGGRGAASPVVVFLSLLALLAVVVGGVIWAGQIDREPLPSGVVGSPEPTEDHSLTDAEAIARFKELDALRIDAFEDRSLDSLGHIFTTNSPARRRLESSIRQLTRDKAFANVNSEVLERDVIERGPNRVVIEELVLYDLRFNDARGRDITRTGALERQRVHWILRLQSGEWLIHDALIVSARAVRR